MKANTLRAAEPATTRPSSIEGKWVDIESARLKAQADKLANLDPENKFTTDFVGYNLAYWAKRGLPYGAADLGAFYRREAFGDSYADQMARLTHLLKKDGVTTARWGDEHYSSLKSEGRTRMALSYLENVQRGPILFIPINFGKQFRLPVVEARNELEENEFMLGNFETGCVLLVQRTWLELPKVKIVSAGDTYDPGIDAEYKTVPMYSHDEFSPERNKLYPSRVHLSSQDEHGEWWMPVGFSH